MIIKRRPIVGGQTYQFRDDCPQGVIDLFMSTQKVISFEFYLAHKYFFPKTKRFQVSGVCESCNKQVSIPMTHLRDRTLESLKHRFICNKCIMKFVGADTIWKKTNSKAQLIAQNRPETLAKNSKAVKKAWANPKTRKKWVEGITKAQQKPELKLKMQKSCRKMWENKKYRQKQRGFSNFTGYAGIFHTKENGDVRFESSYELCYLISCDFKKIKTKRFKGDITYILDGHARYYRPDFEENQTILREIKSSKASKVYQKQNEISAKRKFAVKYCQQNNLVFRMSTEKQIPYLTDPKFVQYLIHVFEKNKALRMFKKRTFPIVESSPRLLRAQRIYGKWNLLKS
jgi:hypothetical protein